MARQINGHLGTFASIEALTAKFPPSESVGCSANVGTAIPYTKAWCDGSQWALVPAPQIQSLVSRAGNDPAPAVRPGRGYVVAADFRAANVAASIGSPVITDVERIAPDGTKLRGIRLASSGSGTNCSFDINIRSQTFATGRLSMLIYSDHTATGFDPNVALYVGDAPMTTFYVGNTWLGNSRGWHSGRCAVLSAGLCDGGPSKAGGLIPHPLPVSIGN